MGAEGQRARRHSPPAQEPTSGIVPRERPRTNGHPTPAEAAGGRAEPRQRGTSIRSGTTEPARLNAGPCRRSLPTHMPSRAGQGPPGSGRDRSEEVAAQPLQLGSSRRAPGQARPPRGPRESTPAPSTAPTLPHPPRGPLNGRTVLSPASAAQAESAQRTTAFRHRMANCGGPADHRH